MDQDIKSEPSGNETRPRGIVIVALLMILFGLAEIATGFTHNFIGLVTSHASFATYLGVALGFFYFLGGLLILTKKKWAAILAIVFLCGDVIGRITMVFTGLYPVNSFLQTFAIVIGTSLAIIFAIYIGVRLRFFELEPGATVPGSRTRFLNGPGSFFMVRFCRPGRWVRRT